MYPNPMPPSYPRPQPGALAAPSPIPTRPITPIDPSIVHSQRPEPTTDPRNQRWSRGDITSFLGQLGNHAEQAQEAGYINSVPAWLRNDRMPPGGLSPEWVDRLQMWKGRLQDMGLPYEQPVEMAEGGEVKTNYADKVRQILLSRAEEENPENPSYEDSQNWTVEQWNEWRKKHPRFEPSPTPTPIARLQGGGRAGSDGYDGRAGVARGGGSGIGFYGGTDGVPTNWFAPSTGQGGLMPGGMRFGPFGGFNPMNASQTELGMYGRPWLDKMVPGRGNSSSASLAGGGEVMGGSGDRDDVPALLQGSAGPGDPGEFVLNKGAVINLGLDFLNIQNNRGLESMAPPSEAPGLNVPKQMWAGGSAESEWSEPTPIPFGTSGKMSSWGDYGDARISEIRNRSSGSRPSSYWGTNPPGNQSMYPTSWKYYSQYGWVPHAQSASGFGGSGAEYTTGGGFNPLAGAGFGSSTFMGGQLGGFNSTGDIPRQLKGI